MFYKTFIKTVSLWISVLLPWQAPTLVVVFFFFLTCHIFHNIPLPGTTLLCCVLYSTNTWNVLTQITLPLRFKEIGIAVFWKKKIKIGVLEILLFKDISKNSNESIIFLKKVVWDCAPDDLRSCPMSWHYQWVWPLPNGMI